jgi:integrase
MARTVRDTNLGSRATRERLKSRGRPYWRTLDEGLHIGYRRLRGASGTWVARRYVGNQTYQTKGIGTADDISDSNSVDVLSFAEAQANARAWRDECSRTGAGITGPITVAQAMEAYLQFLENHRKTARNSHYMYEAFIRPQLGDIEIAALTAEKIRNWHAGLAKEGARLRTRKGEPQKHAKIGKDDESKRRRRLTANRSLNLLRAALNRAFRERKVTSDLQWKLVEPFRGVEIARVRYLTVADAKRLINACDPDFRRLVQAALQTGARYGELTRMKVEDFNEDTGTVAVHISKTGRSRHIVLSDEGRLFFKQVCAGRTGPMFTKADGTKWEKSHQDRPMRAAVKAANISPAISFHGLRHTWASLAVMNAVPLMVVAKNMGHVDTRMVEKHYGHLAPSYMADAIRAGAPKFGFKPDPKIAAL